MGALNSFAFVIVFTIIFTFLLEDFLPEKFSSSEVKGNTTLLPAFLLSLILYLVVAIIFFN